jgi:hypothetical protein
MALPVRSSLIDREPIVSNDTRLAVFEPIRSWRHDHAAVLCAFDVLELDERIKYRASKNGAAMDIPVAAPLAATIAATPIVGVKKLVAPGLFLVTIALWPSDEPL